MLKLILKELKEHSLFTIIGAIGGMALIFFFRNISHETARRIFYIFHPAHVILSALVTSSMYQLHKCPDSKFKCNKAVLLVIGYVGSVGIATLSDSLIPYLGEVLLNLPKRAVHIGFIEEWWLINPAAILGITIAYFLPSTKFPHSGHVLMSTSASLFHVLMAMGGVLSWYIYPIIFIFLFVAVWLPCCVSDIVFPLLFVRNADCSHKH